jgi:hypothetical protein
MSVTRSEFQSLCWKKARHSIANGDCVEIASAQGLVAVRDSKDPSGPIMRYDASVWQSFLSGARSGKFDRIS